MDGHISHQVPVQTGPQPGPQDGRTGVHLQVEPHLVSLLPESRTAFAKQLPSVLSVTAVLQPLDPKDPTKALLSVESCQVTVGGMWAADLLVYHLADITSVGLFVCFCLSCILHSFIYSEIFMGDLPCQTLGNKEMHVVLCISCH